MKKIYLFTALTALATCSLTAQNTVVADPTAEFIGFANVSDLPEDGGAYIFGSEWGVPDLKTVVDADAMTITLQPNFNTYAENEMDAFWVDQDTGEGNKIFEGNTFLADNSLIGEEITFTGGVVSNTLDPSYVAVAFIKVFNADFSVLKIETTPLVAGQDFSVTYTNVEPEDTTVQYGWFVQGVNANPADEADLGSIVITPTTLGVSTFNTITVEAFPNPVTNVLNVRAEQSIDAITVTNLLGQEVLVAAPSTSDFSLNTASLKSGVYMVTIHTAEGTAVERIVKK